MSENTRELPSIDSDQAIIGPTEADSQLEGLVPKTVLLSIDSNLCAENEAIISGSRSQGLCTQQSSYSIGGSNASYLSALSSGHTLFYGESCESESGSLFESLQPMGSNILPSNPNKNMPVQHSNYSCDGKGMSQQSIHFAEGSMSSLVNANPSEQTLCNERSGKSEPGVLFAGGDPKASNALHIQQTYFFPGESKSYRLFDKALGTMAGMANGDGKPSIPFISLPPICLNPGMDLDDSAKQMSIGGWLVVKNAFGSLSQIYSFRGMATWHYSHSIPGSTSAQSSRDNGQKNDSSSDDTDEEGSSEVGQSKPTPSPLLPSCANTNRVGARLASLESKFRALAESPKYDYVKMSGLRQRHAQRQKMRDLEKNTLLTRIKKRR